MKKIGIFSPYLNTLGGGERYMLTAAEYFLKKGDAVDIFWNNLNIKDEIKQRFEIDLSRVNFVEDIFCSKINLFKRLTITRKYDLIFYLSDGSIPFLFAKKNALHFQVPFHGLGGRNFLNKIKLRNINKIVCNSYFTKKFIDKEYGVKSIVIYPPVAVEEFKPGKKENIILSVARFTDALHNKRQDVLVEVFKKMVEGGLKGWKLFLVGGDAEGKKLVMKLKKDSQGYPIEILTNVSFGELKKIYAKAKIFWHAAGYGIDDEKEPEKVEHFGISVVEAMAAGCIPIVVGKGGIKEIIIPGKDGFLWQTKEELENLTFQLIKKTSLIKKISQSLNKSSKRFSKEVFGKKIYELVKD